MKTKKFETRLWLNSNFENYDIELKKYLKIKGIANNSESKMPLIKNALDLLFFYLRIRTL